MSAVEYGSMGTERPIELFIEAARRIGAGRQLFGLFDDIADGVPPDKVARAVKRPEDVAELQALGAVLRPRKPIAEIRRLFESEDRDVRTCAAGQFELGRPRMGGRDLGRALCRGFDPGSAQFAPAGAANSAAPADAQGNVG